MEPESPPALSYHELSIRLEPDGRGGGALRIQRAPIGGGCAPLRLPPVLTGSADWLRAVERRVVRSGRRRDLVQEQPVEPEAEELDPGISEVEPSEVGEALFDALFVDRIKESFLTSLGRVQGEPRKGLSLRLVFDPEQPGALGLAALPWELLCQADGRDFLARSRLTPVVRYLDGSRSNVLRPLATVDAVQPPLQVVVVSSSPPEQPPVSLTRERQELEEAWARQPGIRLHFVPAEQGKPATLEEMRDTLKATEAQVLHFVGHGDFDPESGEGALLFQQRSGEATRVSGSLLTDLLKDLPSLRLVVLNACATACLPRREGLDPCSGVASALTLGGLPGVVAMQFPISDSAALAFSRAFYRSLSAGEPVEAATAEGRLGILQRNEDTLEWITPALYLRTSQGRLLEGVVTDRSTPRVIREKIRDESRLIEERTRGFVGRRWVFDAVEDFLQQGPSSGYFLILGEPGIGKTALLAELVRRHGLPHHFNQRREGVYQPAAFLRNVCAQLIERYRLGDVSLPPEAERDSTHLSALLERVSRQLPEGERAVVLIDALDESDRDGLAPGVNPLYLPSRLPPGVFVVMTTRLLRPEELPSVLCEKDELKIVENSERNLADVRELIGNHLGHPGLRDYLGSQKLTEDELVETLTRKSEGNFMYLSFVLPALERGDYRERAHSDLPSGLVEYYNDHWCRMRGALGGAERDYWLDHKLPVLGALTQIPEPQPLERLAKFAGLSSMAPVLEVLREWRPFLDVSERLDEEGRPVKVYNIYHQTFHDFLVGKEEVAAQRTAIDAREREVLDEAGRNMVVGLGHLKEKLFDRR